MNKSVSLLAVILMLSGCTRLRDISSAEFERQLELNNAQTLSSCEYIGEADGRAYILRKRAPLIDGTWKEEVLFTEIDQLDPRFLRRLSEGK